MDATTYTACNKCNQVNRVPAFSAEGKKPVCGKCKVELSMHDGLSDLTASALAALLQKSKLPVVVDFWATWCQPCKVFAPAFKYAAKVLAGQVVFVKVDTDANAVVGAQYRIRGVPTTIIFVDGVEKERQAGAAPPETFVQWLQTNLDLPRAA